MDLFYYYSCLCTWPRGLVGVRGLTIANDSIVNTSDVYSCIILSCLKVIGWTVTLIGTVHADEICWQQRRLWRCQPHQHELHRGRHRPQREMATSSRLAGEYGVPWHGSWCIWRKFRSKPIFGSWRIELCVTQFVIWSRQQTSADSPETG